MVEKRNACKKISQKTCPQVDAKLLLASEFFQGLSASLLKHILSITIRREVKAGEEIFSDGDPCLAMYLLLRGGVKITKYSEKGREQIIRQVNPGEVFGEAPLFFKKSIYRATAVAQKPGCVLSIPKAGLVELIKLYPEFSLNIIIAISEHVREHVEMMESISFKPVIRRLATHVLELAAKQGGPYPGQVLKLGQTQVELSAQLGTVREVAWRALHQFEKMGAIQVHGQKLKLKDPDKLRNF